jgi:hypothetical protein
MPLDPDKIYRECDARDLFGYGPTVLKEKIKAGTIPRPRLLAPPPSRAKGWYGADIIAWREKVAASQQAWAADAKNFYVPEGGDLRKVTQAAKPKVKVKKLKLRKPKA